MAYDAIGYSIAAYGGSPEVNAFASKYDYSLVGKSSLTKEERKGFALFQGKGKCKLCHLSSGTQPLFTDFTFDNLGIPKNPENPVYNNNSSFVDPGLGGFLATRVDYAAFADANMGKHKVPTLRNVDLRPTPEFIKAWAGYLSRCGDRHFYNTRCASNLPRRLYGSASTCCNCWPAPSCRKCQYGRIGNLGLTRRGGSDCRLPKNAQVMDTYRKIQLNTLGRSGRSFK
jgi:hypothetical protein